MISCLFARLRLLAAIPFLALALLAFQAAPLAAQALFGTILGTVTDSSNAVISAVQVVAIETETNFRRTATTNESGYFVFSNIDPGTYRVEVEHSGFKKLVRAGINVTPNSTNRTDMELSPGQVTESIEVTANAAILQTDRADTGAKIEGAQLQIPMLHNRNYQGVLQLAPGVQKAYRSNSAFYNSQEHLQSVVNGLDQRNNYMIEGIDNNVENLTGIVPPPDAIATVDVSTTNYDPEYGRAGGAVTNVTLKSGSNSFHGSVFEYHRNATLTARNVFSTFVPHTVYNQFGGAGGGRIKKDKLFFFADYQGSRDINGLANLVTIPTEAFRTGDLSAAPSIIYDPATGTPDGRGRVPFAGNRIPANRISPIAQRLINFIEPTTRPGLASNFEKGTSQVKNINQFDTKIDYIIGNNDRLFVRYSYQTANVFDPGLFGPNGGIYGGPHNAGFSGTGPSRNQSPGINYNRIFSPTLVAEFRFGIVRNRNDALNMDQGLTTSRDIGIPLVNLDDWSSGLSEIRVDGFDRPVLGFSPSLPWKRAVTNFVTVNNWNKTKGNHLFKWGVDIRRERQDLLQTQVFNPRGRFNFTAGPTSLNGNSTTSLGNSFAALLLDRPNEIGRDLAVIFPARRNTVFNLYFADKWQVTRSLTLDLGLRWEYWPSSTPRHAGGFSNYNPFNNTLELAGIGSIPRDQGIVNQQKSFAPRFGLAYRLDDKTVIRGGYGISYLLRNTQVYNFPVNQANQLVAPNAFSPAGALATGVPPRVAVQLPDSGVLPGNNAQSYVYNPKDWPQGYVQSWNFAIQRALPGGFTAEVAYVGNHGVNIATNNQGNINASMIPGSGNAGRPLNRLFGRNADVNRTYFAHSSYNSLQAKLNRRYANGLSVTTSYAFGKAIDYNNSTGASAPYFNNVNFQANRGLADWDRRHVFTQNYLYDLPFGAGKKFARSGPAKWILGDWQTNSLWTWNSGLPLDIYMSAASLNAPGNINRPNVNGPVKILGNIGPAQQYFDTSVFSAPLPNTFGNLGRNVLRGPGIFTIDLSLTKKIRITERVNAELRADSFNLTNTPLFDRPNSIFLGAGFGQVTTAAGNQSVRVNENRSFQLSVRVSF